MLSTLPENVPYLILTPRRVKSLVAVCSLIGAVALAPGATPEFWLSGLELHPVNITSTATAVADKIRFFISLPFVSFSG
jgi:hypothetical protein